MNIEITITFIIKAALLVLASAAAFYNDRAIFQERRKGVWNLPSHPLIGNLFNVIRHKESIHDYILEIRSKYNKITWTSTIIGKSRQIFSINPINIEHVLKGNFENYIKGPDFHSLMSDLFGNGIFNANGNNWKIQRKTASHIFNVKNFRNEFIKTFIQEINYMMEHIWDKAVESKSIIDFHDIMYKLTLDSFILLGFGTNINSLGTKDKIPFAEAFDESQRNIFKRFVNPFWPVTEKLINILMPWRKGMNSNLKIMNDFAQSIIKKRREEIKKGETHNDLLSRFIRVSTVYEAPFSDKELRDIILNFIIAGRDTTAQALSWTFYMLISHPTIEAKLFDEIQEYIDDEVLSDSTQLYETIKKMKYAHAIFYEVLRLYPSVPLNQKFALNDDILPDGTPIRRGECFVWSSYAMGRIEEIWGDDAKQFKPDRWFSDDGNLQHESQYKWTSFHAGPRGCLGRDLATLEALATIILLVRKYRFSLVTGQKITYQVSLTLPMKYGMKVAVEKR